MALFLFGGLIFSRKLISWLAHRYGKKSPVGWSGHVTLGFLIGITLSYYLHPKLFIQNSPHPNAPALSALLIATAFPIGLTLSRFIDGPSYRNTAWLLGAGIFFTAFAVSIFPRLE